MVTEYDGIHEYYDIMRQRLHKAGAGNLYLAQSAISALIYIIANVSISAEFLEWLTYASASSATLKHPCTLKSTLVTSQSDPRSAPRSVYLRPVAPRYP